MMTNEMGWLDEIKSTVSLTSKVANPILVINQIYIDTTQTPNPHICRMFTDQCHGHCQGASWMLPSSGNSQDMGGSHQAQSGGSGAQ